MAFPYDAWPEHRRAGTLSRRVLDALKTPEDYVTTDDAARFGVGKVQTMRKRFSHMRASGALRSDNTFRPARYFLGSSTPAPKKARGQRLTDTLSQRVLETIKGPNDYLTVNHAAQFGVTKARMRWCFTYLRRIGALRSDNSARPAKYFLGEGLPITKKISDNGVLLQTLWSAAPTVQEDIS